MVSARRGAWAQQGLPTKGLHFLVHLRPPLSPIQQVMLCACVCGGFLLYSSSGIALHCAASSGCSRRACRLMHTVRVPP